jgi:integrase/recombinase XerD
MDSIYRKRMIQELEIRGRNPKTKTAYVRSMELFVEHYKKDPDDLDIAEIKDYQQYLLIKDGYAPNSVNRHIAGIRFFYTNVLKRWWMSEQVVKVQAPKIIPAILSESEVARMIDCTHSVFYKALVMLMYSSGLRQAEVRNLKASDIDSKRMVINVRCGKGGKDRQALLSPLALLALRTYWRLFRLKNQVKSEWLFIASRRKEKPGKLSHTAIGYIVDTASRAARIKKKLHLTLFATLLQFTF